MRPEAPLPEGLLQESDERWGGCGGMAMAWGCRGRTVRVRPEALVAGRRIGGDGQLERGRAGEPSSRRHATPVCVVTGGRAVGSRIGGGGIVPGVRGVSPLLRPGRLRDLVDRRGCRAVCAGARHGQQRAQRRRPYHDDRERTLDEQ